MRDSQAHATLCDTRGDPYDISHAICLHEEDIAVPWKHVDPHNGAEVRRQRWMVVSSHASVANYDYLSEWIRDDASLQDTDAVLWYVFGIHHIARVEEWPVMPVDVVSFWLKPAGFFNQNPCVDAAPTEKDEDGTCLADVPAQWPGSGGGRPASCALVPELLCRNLGFMLSPRRPGRAGVEMDFPACGAKGPDAPGHRMAELWQLEELGNQRPCSMG